MEETPDHDSWKDWFDRHGPKLLLCARQWTRSMSDAEDIVQEAFVRFWRRQRALAGSPVALVLTSIRRAALDLSRREQRRTARDMAVDPGISEPFFESSADEERRIAIEAALRRLSAEQRQVLVLKIWGECSFDEIGRQLEISPNTAASRYRYALGSLRKHLTEENANAGLP
jgi:RNA polymerase sigma-70 factor, ECF subfamily